MAKKETTTIVLERTYNIPLRREFQKAPRWRRTKKAVIAAREFLQKHMKSDTVLLGTSVNEELWKHGIRNPPHHIKVTAVKDDKGIVRAELFGAKEKKSIGAKGKKEVVKNLKEEKETKPEVAEEPKKEGKTKKEKKPKTDKKE